MRSILLALLLCSPCVGQTIGGLSTLPVLAEGRYPVSGLEVPQGSIDELSKWAQKLVVEASGPDGAEIAVEVDIGLVKRAPTIYFASDKPGLHVLCIVDTGSKTPRIATKRVQVGEVAPPAPNPPTPGPNSPTPGRITKATWVYEKSKHLPNSEEAIALRKAAERGGFLAASLDQDTLSGYGRPPEQYRTALEAAAKVTLPCAVIEYEGRPPVVLSKPSEDDIRKALAQ